MAADANPLAIDLLEKRKLVQRFDTGEIVLTHNALRYGLLCENAVPEHTLRSSATTLEERARLRKMGWTLVDAARSASCALRRAKDNNPHAYYTLLLHFADNLLAYEHEGCFHHSQSAHYYNTVEAAIVANPDCVEVVPGNKKAAFYESLQQFFTGLAHCHELAGDCECKLRKQFL